MSLLCRNCGAVNPDGSTKCGTCQIEGKFSPKETPQNPIPLQQVENKWCRNCDNNLPENAISCPVCRFTNDSTDWNAKSNTRISHSKKIIFN